LRILFLGLEWFLLFNYFYRTLFKTQFGTNSDVFIYLTSKQSTNAQIGETDGARHIAFACVAQCPAF